MNKHREEVQAETTSYLFEKGEFIMTKFYNTCITLIMAAFIALAFTPTISFAEEDTSSEATAVVEEVKSYSDANAVVDVNVTPQNTFEGDKTYIEGDKTYIEGDTTTNTNETNIEMGDTNFNDGDTIVNDGDTNVKTGDTTVNDGDTIVNDGDTNVDSHDDNSSTTAQKVVTKYTSPKPLAGFTSIAPWPVIPASAWPEGNLLPEIFRGNQVIQNLTIMPSMPDNAILVGRPWTMKSLEIEFTDFNLEDDIYNVLLQQFTLRPTATAVAIYVRAKTIDISTGKGINLNGGLTSTSGGMAHTGTGYNKATAHKSIAYFITMTFFRAKPVVVEPEVKCPKCPKCEDDSKYTEKVKNVLGCPNATMDNANRRLERQIEAKKLYQETGKFSYLLDVRDDAIVGIHTDLAKNLSAKANYTRSLLYYNSAWAWGECAQLAIDGKIKTAPGASIETFMKKQATAITMAKKFSSKN